MSDEKEVLSEIVENDSRINLLKYLLPNHRFQARRIGEFIILYHNIRYLGLTKDEQDKYLTALRKIKKTEPDNITMIYDKELEEQKGD